jgi:hypothetical protein
MGHAELKTHQRRVARQESARNIFQKNSKKALSGQGITIILYIGEPLHRTSKT